MLKQCQTCRFGVQNQYNIQCHRYPPVTYLWPTDNQHPIMYTPVTEQPYMNEGEWCGKWKDRATD